MIDGLLERAVHIPVWVLSLGNAVVGIDELEQKMARLGRKTRAIELRYQHLPAVATAEKKATNKEFLVVGWDPESPVLRRLAPRQDGTQNPTQKGPRMTRNPSPAEIGGMDPRQDAPEISQMPIGALPRS